MSIIVTVVEKGSVEVVPVICPDCLERFLTTREDLRRSLIDARDWNKTCPCCNARLRVMVGA